jgi:hypothetical protein
MAFANRDQRPFFHQCPFSVLKSGLIDLTISKTHEASIVVALPRDIKLFEQTAPSTHIVSNLLAEKIQLILKLYCEQHMKKLGMQLEWHR